MNVILSDWRGPRMLAFKWWDLRFEWGHWCYHIDKYGCCIMTWAWEREDHPLGGE